MDRIKYLFIMKSETLTPEDFNVLHDTEGDYTRLMAVSSFDLAVETAEKMADQGFTQLDLCGDFDEAQALEIKTRTGKRLDVRYAKYSIDDDKRMSEMSSLDEYGIIMMDGSISETEWVYKKHNEFNTTIAFVNSLDTTIEAVKEMVEKGISFVEMCRWYDEDKSAKVSRAINKAVPIGFCG